MARFAILGPGRLGSTLARALRTLGHEVTAIAGGGEHGAQLAAEVGARHIAAEALPAVSDVIFATVPDRQLARATGPLPVDERHAVVHCSGAAGLEALQGVAGRGAAVACMHPLQSFPTRQLDASQLRGVYVGIEVSDGAPAGLDTLLRDVVRGFGGHVLSLRGVDRAAYHAAAVLASNAVVGLHAAAEEAWTLAGLTGSDARPALAPLTLGAARAIEALPLGEALTGPVARGDVTTVRGHLLSLSPRHALSQLYRALSQRMLDTGQPADPRRRAQLQTLLGTQPQGPALAEPARPEDERFMRMAMAEADAAAAAGDVPVGCVLVRDGEVIARGGNLREAERDPLGHAELSALRSAAQQRGDWRLSDVTAYVTLEPCPMCAGALVHSRVARVVYGCDDEKAGALRSLYQLGSDPRLNHRFSVTAGVLADECANQLSRFFAEIRDTKGRA